MVDSLRYTAFAGMRRLAAGPLGEVAAAVKRAEGDEPVATVLIFDDASGEQVDLDLRGTLEDVAGRYQAEPASADAQAEPEAARGRGRPKLGVVAREVTLLPRHWEWLNGQPGGASVALRKLVEAARRENEGRDRVRRAREAAYRFTNALAGNLPGFEEASRALFASDRARFEAETAGWPPDVRDHARSLAAPAFADDAAGGRGAGG